MSTVIDRAEVERMLREGAQLLEVLASDEYAEEHIRGAENLPLAELRADTAARFDAKRSVVVYCHDRD